MKKEDETQVSQDDLSGHSEDQPPPGRQSDAETSPRGGAREPAADQGIDRLSVPGVSSTANRVTVNGVRRVGLRFRVAHGHWAAAMLVSRTLAS